MELSGGRLVVAAQSLKKLHLFDSELSNAALEIPLPTQHGTFNSMSLATMQTRELIACSFTNPNSLIFFEIKANTLQLVKWIPLDFDPFRSVWLQSQQRLLVFSGQASKRAAMICLHQEVQQLSPVEFDKTIYVLSSCILRENENLNDEKEKVFVFDASTSSLMELQMQ